MDTILLQIKNEKAYKLIENLEALNIVKVIQKAMLQIGFNFLFCKGKIRQLYKNESQFIVKNLAGFFFGKPDTMQVL
jgi:predicted membrane protein